MLLILRKNCELFSSSSSSSSSKHYMCCQIRNSNYCSYGCYSIKTPAEHNQPEEAQ